MNNLSSSNTLLPVCVPSFKKRFELNSRLNSAFYSNKKLIAFYFSVIPLFMFLGACYGFYNPSVAAAFNSFVCGAVSVASFTSFLCLFRSGFILLAVTALSAFTVFGRCFAACCAAASSFVCGAALSVLTDFGFPGVFAFPLTALLLFNVAVFCISVHRYSARADLGRREVFKIVPFAKFSFLFVITVCTNALILYIIIMILAG